MLPSALEHVEEIGGAGDRSLAIFLDYDGTLTPIVSRPDQAVLMDSTQAILRTLAAKMPVAILSGQKLKDVCNRVGIAGIVNAGSHGFDIAVPRALRRQQAPEFFAALDAAE